MKYLALGVVIVAMLLSGCVSEFIISKGQSPYNDSTYLEYTTGSPDLLTQLRSRPYYVRDGLPNSDLQIKAYQSAHRDVSQFGQWCGGFFLGLPYAVITSFSTSNPPMYDFSSIPPDSVYWYSRYYGQEVRQIRTMNAWWGFSTRVAVAITTYLIARKALLKLGD